MAKPNRTATRRKTLEQRGVPRHEAEIMRSLAREAADAAAHHYVRSAGYDYVNEFVRQKYFEEQDRLFEEYQSGKRFAPVSPP